MNTDLLTQVGVFTPDSLVARVTPPAEAFGVEIAALAASSDDVELKRGTLLGRGADGKYSAFGGSSEAKVNEIPAATGDVVDVDPNSPEAMKAAGRQAALAYVKGAKE